MSQSRTVTVLGALVLAVPLLLVTYWAFDEFMYRRAVAMHTQQQEEAVARLTAFTTHATYRPDGTVVQLTLTCERAGQSVTAQRLEPLRKLEGLCDLVINHCSLCDDAFRRLGELPFLNRIGFYNTTFAGASLRHLASLPRLVSITFRNSSLTDASLAHLAELDGLMYLTIEGKAEFQGESVRYLAKLPRLARLTFRNTSLTDAGLEQLVEVDWVTDLAIVGSEITDAAVSSISKMTFLDTLVLDSTPLSQEAGDRIREALPSTQIEWTPWDPADKRFGWQTRMEVMSRRMKDQETKANGTDQGEIKGTGADIDEAGEFW